MTLTKLIAMVDEVKPNQYTQEQKIGWISYLDAMVFNSVMSVHKDSPVDSFVPYTEEDMDKDLLIPFPHDEVYVYYMKMKIDEFNEEMSKYNNDALLFNSGFNDYTKEYHRKHEYIEQHNLIY